MSAIQTLTQSAAATAASVPLRHNAGLQLNTNVDQDGAFRQDKVLRSGWLQKRTRKTKVREMIAVATPSSAIAGERDQGID
jgi:hypothetical protein